MSTTIEVPRGLDKLSPEEERLMESMRDDIPAPETPAATPEPAAAPAAPAAETTEDFEIEVPEAPEATPTADRRGNMVPQQALHQSREKLKAEIAARAKVEAELAAERAQRAQDAAVLQARVDMIAKVAEMQQPAPVPTSTAPVAEELPDVNTDPIGHFRAANQQQQKQIEALTGMVRGQQEVQQQAQRAAQLRQWGEAQELAFEAQEPSYREAMGFLRQQRHDELAELGITNPAAREEIIGKDVAEIALRAQQRGINFAEQLYKVSQKRGFVKAAPAAPVAPALPALDPDDDIDVPAPVARAERIARGRENSTTIGSLGSAPPARLSVEKIANMPEKDFAVFIERYKDNPAALRQLMGE